MLKSSCLLSLLALAGFSTMSCRESRSNKSDVSPAELRQSSWRFVQETRLLGESGASGGFQTPTFPSTGFWPATPLVVPARAAAFINETYGASSGFTYQSFEFTSAGCSAGNAFARYFQAIEELRGTPVSEAEKSQIETTFQGAFGAGEIGILNQSVCLLYDLMACIADYSVLNKGQVQDAAQSGDISIIMTGVASCVAEITGIDPTDTIDPFDPESNLPDE